MRSTLIRSIVALAGLAGAAGMAGAENRGRITQPHEVVRTSIFPTGDSDDLAFDAGAGWKVQATMKVKGQVELPPPPEGEPPPALTALAPVVELVAPDGSVETEGVVAKSSKKSATLKATLAEGGRFALRLRGSAGTGIVEVKWKLTPAKIAPFKGVVVGANQTVDFPFAARGGALLTWKLTIKGDGAVEVAQLLDPDGVEIAYDPDDPTYTKRTLTSESVKNFPVPADRPGGEYRLRILSKVFPATVTLSVKVALPKVPASFATLTRLEPVLTEIGRSEGGCGIRITLTGQNLDPAPQGVLLGSASALSVDVVQGAAETDPDTCGITVPGGAGTVDVVFVASDGQRAFLPDAFTFSPLPVITSFSPNVGPGPGNILITVKGTGFEYPSQGLYKIMIGGFPCSNVQVVDEQTITGKTPAHAAGPKTVLIRNLCNEDSVAADTFTYAITLNISTVVPDAVPVFGGVPVVVYGTNLSLTNQVYLDGALVPSTPVLSGVTVIGHRVAGADVPAHAPGKVDVEIRDGMTSAVKTGGLAYYTFTDITADNGSGTPAVPAASATDDWGGVSTAVSDTNADGEIDLIFITHTAGLSANRPGTRILKNNGDGTFFDATAALMPTPTANESYAGHTVLASDFQVQAGVPKYPDIFLARAGTGPDPRRTGDKKFVDAWALMLFGSSGQGFTAQPSSGAASKFSITGLLSYKNCYQYDFDFRSVGAALGDLDNDLDQDIVLVNNVSISSYKGGSNYSRWITCAGGYYSSWYDTVKSSIGSALRFCTVSSSGSVLDRTADLLKTPFSAADDFRGVAAAVGDMNRDSQGLNDVVVVHDTYPGGNMTSCTRVFQQKVEELISTFTKFNTTFLPAVTSATDDDWRGHTVSIPDLNNDLYRDMVLGYDGPLPTGRPFSTRILINDSISNQLLDRTSTLLTGLLPSGDYGRARFVVGVDIDSDGDRDILLTTPNSTGSGNPQTRLLLNVAKDDVSGLPVFINGTALLPVAGADAGAGVSIATGDIDGDGDLDVIVTNARDGNATRKTRIWRQDR